LTTAHQLLPGQLWKNSLQKKSDPDGPSTKEEPGLKQLEYFQKDREGAPSITTQPSISTLRMGTDREKVPVKRVSIRIRNQKKIHFSS
jgi:hypothetical protein